EIGVCCCRPRVTLRPPESFVVVSQMLTDSFAACAGVSAIAKPDVTSAAAETARIRSLIRRLAVEPWCDFGMGVPPEDYVGSVGRRADRHSPFIHFLVQDVIELRAPVLVKGLNQSVQTNSEQRNRTRPSRAGAWQNRLP